jgi:hypothetical protein
MNLTYNELKLLRGVLRSKKMYKGMKIPLSVVIWEDWMEESLEKVEKELYRINPNTPEWK